MSEPRDQHDDFRQLFADATSDIRPQGSLEDILDRSKKVDPMTRRWFLPVVAAAAVIGFVIGGAVWIAHDSNSPSSGGPSGNPSATETATAAPVEDIAVPVYYAGDTAAGTRLFTEEHTLSICVDQPCRLRAGLGEVLSGTPADADYRSLWPADAAVDEEETTSDDKAIVIGLTGNLADRPAGMSAADAKLAVQELFLTAQAALDQSQRTFELVLNGQHTFTLLGTRIPNQTYTEQPVEAMAPVQITSLQNGATVPAGKVTVGGVAATFEGNVVWEVMGGGDTVVKSGHTTAKECCTLAPYSFTVDLEPGTYTIVVHDTDESGEGRPTNQDTKEIVVE